MRKLIFGVLGLVLLNFSTLVSAQNARSNPSYNLASDNRLITSITLDDMSSVIRALGHTVKDDGLKEGQPFIHARSKEGQDYTLLGRACGEVNHCMGLIIRTNYPLSVPGDYKKVNDINIRHAAISSFVTTHNFSVSRYLILDHGVTMRNIKLNIDVLLSSANSAAEYYFDGKVPEVQETEAPNELQSSANQQSAPDL